MVDWELAGRIARVAAGDGPAGMEPGLDLRPVASRAEEAVLAYTGLTVAEPLPEAEWVSRREWAAINLASMRELIEPVEERLGSSLPGRAGRLLAPVAGALLAVEIGALLGFASKRVLGQYELSLLGRERPVRLLFVGPNIQAATGQLGGRPADVLEWVTLHEVTHAAHFAATPWLRDHLGARISELLAGSSLGASPRDLIARGGRLISSDPRRTLAALRESDPMTLLASGSSQAVIAQLQAAMAAIEGYAEHVMDAAATELGPVVADLRRGIERRRQSRSPLVRLILWLLGFEMKLRQYRDGKRFADEVAARAGIDGLNAAWHDPGALPTLGELADPEAWIRRVDAVAVPAGRRGPF